MKYHIIIGSILTYLCQAGKNHEKHEICLVPKMPCVSYNEQQLFQVSNVPRSLITNMNGPWV